MNKWTMSYEPRGQIFWNFQQKKSKKVKEIKMAEVVTIRRAAKKLIWQKLKLAKAAKLNSISRALPYLIVSMITLRM